MQSTSHWDKQKIVQEGTTGVHLILSHLKKSTREKRKDPRWPLHSARCSPNPHHQPCLAASFLGLTMRERKPPLLIYSCPLLILIRRQSKGGQKDLERVSLAAAEAEIFTLPHRELFLSWSKIPPLFCGKTQNHTERKRVFGGRRELTHAYGWWKFVGAYLCTHFLQS